MSPSMKSPGINAILQYLIELQRHLLQAHKRNGTAQKRLHYDSLKWEQSTHNLPCM
jgi:hypothetical protein